MSEAPPQEQQQVQMDAAIQVTQNKLTRDDELRLSALNIATRDRIHFGKDSAEPNHVQALTDAKAYYAWLTDTTTEGDTQ
jgi:hypothetical protein